MQTYIHNNTYVEVRVCGVCACVHVCVCVGLYVCECVCSFCSGNSTQGKACAVGSDRIIMEYIDVGSLV